MMYRGNCAMRKSSTTTARTFRTNEFRGYLP